MEGRNGLACRPVILSAERRLSGGQGLLDLWKDRTQLGGCALVVGEQQTNTVPLPALPLTLKPRVYPNPWYTLPDEDTGLWVVQPERTTAGLIIQV